MALAVIAILLCLSDQAQTSAVAPAPSAPSAGAVVDAAAPVIPALPLVQVPFDTFPVFSPPVAASDGEIVITARADWEAPDPLAGINAKSFEATQTVDRALIGPVAMTYKKKVPGPVRDGIHNFLYNLREPVVFLNFLLQHKIGKAAETVGRFVVNTTVGAIGLFDIARRKPFRLPRRSNGFANTLGFYGVPNGTFLYLPLVGPTTIRDLLGGAVDRLVLPITLGQGVTDPKFAIPAGVLGALDHRAEFDETYKAVDAAPGDRYGNARDFYLQRRQAEIDGLHGRGKSGISGAGGMTEAPTGAVRLKGRGGAAGAPIALPPETLAPAPLAPVPTPPATPDPAAAPAPVAAPR